MAPVAFAGACDTRIHVHDSFDANHNGLVCRGEFQHAMKGGSRVVSVNSGGVVRRADASSPTRCMRMEAFAGVSSAMPGSPILRSETPMGAMLRVRSPTVSTSPCTGGGLSPPGGSPASESRLASGAHLQTVLVQKVTTYPALPIVTGQVTNSISEDVLDGVNERLMQLKDIITNVQELVHTRLSECEYKNASFDILQEDVQNSKVAQARVSENVDRVRENVDRIQERLSAMETQGQLLSEIQNGIIRMADDSEKLAGKHATLEERVAGIVERMDGSNTSQDVARLTEEVEFLSVADTARTREVRGIQEGYVRNIEASAALQARLDHMQGVLEECETQGGSIHELRALLNSSSSTAEARFDQMEKAIGDSVSRHADKIDHLHGRLLACENQGPPREVQSLLDRLSQVEGVLGGSLDAEKRLGSVGQLEAVRALDVSVIDRLDNLEQVIGGSAEKHHATVNDLRLHIAEIHGTVTDRLGHIEEVLGDSMDQHRSRLDSFQGRLQALQPQIEPLSPLRRSVNDFGKMHASVVERLDLLEKVLGDSSDLHNEQHGRNAESLEAVRARLEAIKGEHTDYWDAAHAKMQQMHGSLAEQLQAQLQGLHGKHGELTNRLSSYEEHGAHIVTVNERLAYLETSNRDLTNTIEHLEQMRGRMSAHERQMETLREKVRHHHVMMAEDHIQARKALLSGSAEPPAGPTPHVYVARPESPSAYSRRLVSPERSDREVDMQVVMRGTVGKAVVYSQRFNREIETDREDAHRAAVVAAELAAADVPAEEPGPSKKVSLYRAALEMQRRMG